jgi:thiamine transport system substrate-binding protein
LTIISINDAEVCGGRVSKVDIIGSDGFLRGAWAMLKHLSWPRALLLLFVIFNAVQIYRMAPTLDLNQNKGGVSEEPKPILRLLAYSSFLTAWGPGPELIKNFELVSGAKVEIYQAEDAGVMLQKVEIVEPDIVIGFDQLLIRQARAKMRWYIPEVKIQFEQVEPDGEFIPFDWAPLAFVLRRDGIKPPGDLNDLLDMRFQSAIAIQDPRTSSPGLQLLFWIMDEYGVDGGFEFLQKLKPNLQSVSPSWSTAYGMFSKKQAQMVFSYFTSPLYHLVEENNSNYISAEFVTGHPIQVEYIGIPALARNKALAEKFIRFSAELESQKIIMRKNFMLPIFAAAAQKTDWAKLPAVKIRNWKNLEALISKKSEILDRWSRLAL